MAGEVDDFGNPLRFLLFPDGMTIYTGRTPKFPRESKGDNFIESRTVAHSYTRQCGQIFHTGKNTGKVIMHYGMR